MKARASHAHSEGHASRITATRIIDLNVREFAVQRVGVHEGRHLRKRSRPDELKSIEKLQALDSNRLPLVDASARIGPCVGGVGKFIPSGSTFRITPRSPVCRRPIVSDLSRLMSMQPGDIVSTGTPAGVGLGQEPPTYLRPGKVVRLGIDGLGEQRQVCRSEEVTR